jgi:hypothetical protein
MTKLLRERKVMGTLVDSLDRAGGSILQTKRAKKMNNDQISAIRIMSVDDHAEFANPEK